MDTRKIGKVSTLKRSLSTLTSHINNWSASNSPSPSRKKPRISPSSVCDFKQQNLYSDLQLEENCASPWYQTFSPKSVTEVSIHKRKLKDVREALEAMIKGESGSRILLLTGPSGSCKSAVVTQLANEMIPKFRPPSSSGFSASKSKNGFSRENIIEYENDTIPNGTSHFLGFQEFLSQAKYRIGPNLAMILIEDVPNVFHYGTRMAFQSQLLEWLYSSETNLPPLVICLTECEIENETYNVNAFGVDQTFTAESVLGKEILTHSRLKRIKFNPVNKGLMKKTLMNLCLKNKECLLATNKWSQRELVVEELAQSSGDIRSAIGMLQFWATSTVNTTLLTRESFVSYFHAIGKILYGSNEHDNDNEVINSLISSSHGHLSHHNFRLGLLENYGSYNKGKFAIERASRITNALSESDMMESVPEFLEYAMRKVRNTLHEIVEEGNSHGRAIFPREGKIRLAQNEFKIKCDDYANVNLYKYGQSRLVRDVALQFGFYDPHIKRARYYKDKSLAYYMAQERNDDRMPEIVEENYNLLQVDPEIDILDRIGGELSLAESQDNMSFEDDDRSTARQSVEYLKSSRDTKLQKLVKAYNEKVEEAIEGVMENEKFEDDPISESDEGNEASTSKILEDDDSIYDLLSQNNPKTKNTDTSINESLSDSDLEHL